MLEQESDFNAERECLLAQIKQERQRAEELHRTLLAERGALQAIIDDAQAQLIYLDPQFNVLRVSAAYAQAMGLSPEQLIGQNVLDLFPDSQNQAMFEHARDTGQPVKFRAEPPERSDVAARETACRNWSLKPVKVGTGHVEGLVLSLLDGTERRYEEEALRQALEAARQRQAEVSALLEGSRAVLHYREFEAAARSIFDTCKRLVGATAGYIALLTADGTENEVLFLDAGGADCTVDPTLPMPVRGLREQACLTGKTVYDNGFSKSDWTQFIPPGHADIDNVLFAPLEINGIIVGLVGLANKPGGFTDNDARIAGAFGELATIALLNSRTLESLQNSEERFHSVAETASDAIMTIDSRGDITYWNTAAASIFGYRPDEVIGRSLTSIMPERLRAEHCAAVERVLSTGKTRILGETVEMVGLRRDGCEFPVELSLSKWKMGEEVFFTGIIRDITARKQVEEEVQRLARFPSENRNPVLRVSADGTIRYANEASAPLLALWATGVGQVLPEAWCQLTADAIRSGKGRTVEVASNERIFAVDLAPVTEAGYVNLYGRDITERVRAETTLREQNQFITAAIEALNHPFYVIDANDYTIKMANSATQHGTLPASAKCFAVTHRSDAPCVGVGYPCPLEEARVTKQPVIVEHLHYDREGRRRYYEVHGHPIFDDAGNLTQLIEYTLDVTERRRAEEALQKAHDELERRVEERTAELAQATEESREVAIQNAQLYEAELRARQLAETLSDASLALTQTLNLDTVLDTLLRYLHRIIPYDSANVILPRDEHRLVVRAARGYERRSDAQEILGTTVDAQTNPHIREMLTTGKSYVVPDTRELPEFRHTAGVEHALSWLGVPVVAGSRVIGICGLDKAEPGFFTSNHVQMAEGLVGQAAVAVQNAWLFEQVRAGRERLQALSRRLVEVQESERRYIARELHDEAGQALTSLKVGLRLLEREAGRPEAVATGVTELRARLDGVLENLHRLAMDLRPASLDLLGMEAALRQYAETISDQHGLAVQFEAVGLRGRLPPEKEVAIYRIVQEALTNVVRHAQATRVDVLLKQRGDKLIVMVEDNGVGYDPTATMQTGRLGVFGMRERAEMLGGRLVLEGAAGAGTTLLLEVPNADPNIDCG